MTIPENAVVKDEAGNVVPMVLEIAEDGLWIMQSQPVGEPVVETDPETGEWTGTSQQYAIVKVEGVFTLSGGV